MYRKTRIAADAARADEHAWKQALQTGVSNTSVIIFALVAVGIATFIIALPSGAYSDAEAAVIPTLVTNAGQGFLDVLVGLLIVATLVERAQEVFITSWREPQKVQIQDEIDDLAKRLEIPGLNQEAYEYVRQEYQYARWRLNEFRGTSARWAFAFSMTIGIVLAALMFPVLCAPSVTNFAEVKGGMTHVARTTLQFIDILLAAALVGGGAEAIHKVISVFTDFLDSTRERIGASGTRAPDSKLPRMLKAPIGPPGDIPPEDRLEAPLS